MIHIYQGFCPDNLEPDSRDPDCPACQVEAERNNLRAEVARLTAELAWIHHAASWLKNNNKNPRAWQCIQGIIDRSTQDGE